jgi:hypothetical protein
MRIRKQVYELTLRDLSSFPVWEFALDEECEEGQDEATVRPYEVSGPLDPRAGRFVVRAGFTLCNGSPMQGYLTPLAPGDDLFGTAQPVVITDQGQVGFWYGVITPDARELARNYRLLGADADEAFPIHFESQVEVLFGPVRGTLPGFLVLEDFETGRTGIVK